MSGERLSGFPINTGSEVANLSPTLFDLGMLFYFTVLIAEN